MWERVNGINENVLLEKRTPSVSSGCRVLAEIVLGHGEMELKGMVAADSEQWSEEGREWPVYLRVWLYCLCLSVCPSVWD